MLPLVTHPSYSYEFPAKHRFAMDKFARLAEYLRGQGILTRHNVYRPGICKSTWLEAVHCPSYISRFVSGELTKVEERRLNLPWSEGLVKRTLISPAGTVLAAQLALHTGMACHLAGGTHHAHYDYASGFCVFNDLAIAAKVLLQSSGIDRVLIFDCDVHQGDGTALLLKDEPRAFTCSIHCGKNFPFTKQLSDLDVELDDGMSDGEYLAVVENTLNDVITRFNPQVVLYDAGVDIYAGDPLGRLNISLAGIEARDRLVLSTLKELGIPVATVIGGGYDDDREALARRHAIVVEVAHSLTWGI
jgi:acetoin utilization deacetylase AcuC-like enzyme